MRFKGRIKKWIYENIPGFSGRFPYFGTNVYFPKNSHLFERACDSGIYEFDILSLMWKLIEPNSCLLDVGANIGLMSVPILKTVPSCQVVSFEPSPNAFPYLSRTRSESAYKDRWTLINQAAGAHCGSISFCINEPGLGAFDGRNDTKRVKSAGKITVSMTAIDKVWRELGSPHVSLIKIDVEGSEIEVLKGATACLSTNRPYVVLEWNAANLKANHTDPAVLLDFAEDSGYTVFSARDLMPVINRASLRLQMKMGNENYLIGPDPGVSAALPRSEEPAEYPDEKHVVAR